MDQRPLRMQLDSLRQRRDSAAQHHARIQSEVRRARKTSGNVPAALFSEFIHSRDHLHELARQIREGEAERNRLVEINQGLVYRTALDMINDSAFIRSRIELDDAVQEGEMAEVRAAEKWNPALGSTFCTYAVQAVHNAIVQKARAGGRGPRVPQYVSTLLQRERHGETLQPGEVTSIDRARHAWGCRSLSGLFDCPAREDEEPESDLLDLLRPAMAKLEPRDRRILKRRYWKAFTYQEIGDLEGLTKERIRQLLYRARQRLKSLLKSQAVGAI